MVTKSKSINLHTNFFVGLISWTAFLALIYTFSCIVAGLVLILFQSNLSGDIGRILYLFPQFHKIPQEVLIRLISVILLTILSVVLTVVFRKERKQFEAALAGFLSYVWIEIKLAVAPLIIYLSCRSNIFWLLLLCIILIIYLFCLDIGCNKTVFRRNISASLLNMLNKAKKDSTYEYVSVKRMISTIGVILSILIFDALSISLITYLEENYFPNSKHFEFIIPSLIFLSLSGIIGSLVWYYLSLKKDLEDLSVIMMQIKKMYSGNLNAVNQIPLTSQFYDMAMQLNMIRTGIEKAVDEGVKADKTKVELITNVSHDIKTPLTSIITYVELLKQEPNLPEHVQDYIQTLSNKANRLSHIVQDVFEVSKAATGNLALNMETLDLTKLAKQTLAEMEETMSKTQITWRLDIPDYPLMIQADGQKLYRVFQNLIRNCGQYALEGSRAYIDVKKVSDFAEFTIRNIARTELDSSAAGYLTGRFVRGDQNRTTEGSGLGLSIAKSFTEACGGKFILQIDGDVFLVKVVFALEPAVPVPAPAEILPAAASQEDENEAEKTKETEEQSAQAE